MQTENERDRENRARIAIARGRRKTSIAELDAWYLGHPEAIDLCCRRLLEDIINGEPNSGPHESGSDHCRLMGNINQMTYRKGRGVSDGR